MASLTPRLDRLDQNLIINGNFDYWQRNITGTVNGYVCDRFRGQVASGTFVQSRSTDVPDADSQYSFSLAATSAIGAQLSQRVESLLSYSKANKTITFRVKVKVTDNTNTPIKFLINIPTVKDNFSTVTNFHTSILDAAPVSGVWKTYSKQITLPASVSNGVEFAILRDSGVAATTTTLFSKIMITQDTDLERDFCYAGRNIFEEFNLARRYFCKSYEPNTPRGSITNNGVLGFSIGTTSSSSSDIFYQFPVPMRTVPTVTPYSNSSGASNVVSTSGGDATASINANSNMSFSLGYVNGIVTARALYFHYTADAEL